MGDKNITGHVLLGNLYQEALSAQGFTVILNPNIGPTEVTIQAMESGRLDMYPEYLDTWNLTIAGYKRPFASTGTALRAARHYASAHGFTLLSPTPFSDTSAIGVTRSYALQNSLRTIGDLRRVAATVGALARTLRTPPTLAWALCSRAPRATIIGHAVPPTAGGHFHAIPWWSGQEADAVGTLKTRRESPATNLS